MDLFLLKPPPPPPPPPEYFKLFGDLKDFPRDSLGPSPEWDAWDEEDDPWWCSK